MTAATEVRPQPGTDHPIQHPAWCVPRYCTANSMFAGAHRSEPVVVSDVPLRRTMCLAAHPDEVQIETSGPGTANRSYLPVSLARSQASTMIELCDLADVAALDDGVPEPPSLAESQAPALAGNSGPGFSFSARKPTNPDSPWAAGRHTHGALRTPHAEP